MESRRHQSRAIAICLLALAMAKPAAAFEQGSHAGAEVTEDGIREMIEREYANGAPGSPGGGKLDQRWLRLVGRAVSVQRR